MPNPLDAQIKYTANQSGDYKIQATHGPLFGSGMPAIEYTLSVKVDGEKTGRAASIGYLNATDLADYLVRKGLEFRKAHDLVGRVVVHAIERGKPLEEISIEEYQGFSAVFEEDLYDSLTIEAFLASKSAVGGTTGYRDIARGL